MKKNISFFAIICTLLFYAQSPFSKFNISLTSSPNTIIFSDESVGNPTSIFWEFEGGSPSSSNIPNPEVVYSSPGIYKAKLTVRNASGSSVSMRTIKVSAEKEIDLSTGRNDDGTLMAITSVSNTDWKYTHPNGTVSTPITRHTYTSGGWSFAQIANATPNSVWITGDNIDEGNHYFDSKEFEIPEGITKAVLNLRSLSFVRNWTYLVKKNDDGTSTETQITATTWMSDGAKGWLNSRSPLVSNYQLSPGKYFLRVKVYANKGQQHAVDVNANVSFGFNFTFSPVVQFNASSISSVIGEFVKFNSQIESTPTSLFWKFYNGTNMLTSELDNPSISFNKIGKYNVELISDYGNDMISAFSVNQYINVIEEVDYKRAPNSYIFYEDGILPDGRKVDGLYIPLKKAYQMWKEGRYMENDSGIHTPINLDGQQSASVYWEDVNGLIKSSEIDTSEGSGENAKIKVIIDKTKGKGNAVIAFKVDNVIYWTWHIWVTDNPENGGSYGQGFETDKEDNLFVPQYMDRNLGATNANFLGHDWNKSGGLMYTWGRKDPFPPLVYKDGTFYEITGEIGAIRHKKAAYKLNATELPIKIRGIDTGTNKINGNIRYSINYPIHMIIHGLNDGTWFSDQEYKLPNSKDTSLVETWDLWSDNRKGLNSNASSSNNILATDSKSYELKSEFDPCPNGWRIPSHYGRNTINNNLNPFGRKNSGVNDDLISTNSVIYPTNYNPVLRGIKVYPGIGIDFRGVLERNLGILPMSGGFEYYGPDASGVNFSNVISAIYQDQSSETSLTTATYGIGGVRGLIVNSDPARNDISSTGLNNILTNQIFKTTAATAVRCIKDPNLRLIPNFDTQFMISKSTDSTDYKSWIKEPNSFVIMTGGVNDSNATDQVLKISLKKAYAMHKLYLSENHEIPTGNIKTASIVWTSNTDLIKDLKITGIYPNEILEVTIAAKQKGNAVIASHKGDNGLWGQSNPDKILWSWHIWAPFTNPLDYSNNITYTTESIENEGILSNVNEHFINPTKSLLPPLTTTFMDRNLGALYSFPLSAILLGATGIDNSEEITNSGGLHYQWGRKDPIPTFFSPGGIHQLPIYKQIDYDNGTILYSAAIYNAEYELSYTKEYTTYTDGLVSTLPKHQKINNVIKYATENPLFFMYRNKEGNEETLDKNGALSQKVLHVKDWLSDENGLAQDRWGHATEKSPYDPCPLGWRVPDTSFANLWNGAKGNSPWFYNGVNTNGKYNDYGIGNGVTGLTESERNNTSTEYLYPGFTIIRYSKPTSRVGFIFSFPNSNYNIGNIPITGIRGIFGGNTYNDELWSLYLNNTYRTGLWTSSPADFYSGYALSLDLYSVSSNSGQNGRLATGIGRYPQAAMGVRCAKDTERYMGDLPYTIPKMLPLNKSNRINMLGVLTSENRDVIEVYPNPTKEYLHINNEDHIIYEIYDFNGNLIKKGKVNNKKINVIDLTKGLYMLKLYKEEQIKLVKKIIIE